MITNMEEFFNCVNTIIKKLIENNDIENAKRLQNALQISNSGLEILGETRIQLKYLEKNKIFKKIGCVSDVQDLRRFISKYWPGY